jgi:serine/threonine protein kinase
VTDSEPSLPEEDTGATTGSPSDDRASGRHRPAGIPATIGPYAIRRMIASGGMGTIYQGMQEHRRRPVAVKVMKHGIASPEALRRFQYEASSWPGSGTRESPARRTRV